MIDLTWSDTETGFWTCGICFELNYSFSRHFSVLNVGPNADKEC